MRPGVSKKGIGFMKKQTLLAASLLSAAAVSAAASDIQVYGVLDYGLTWQDRTNADGSDSAALQMTSGQYIGSPLASKAPKLANGLKVGFVLENGFGADTGSLGQNGRLFGRDARLFSTEASATCHLAVWAPWWAATAPMPASVTS